MNEQSKYYLPEKLENDFRAFYQTKLLQNFMFLEPQRKKYLRQFFCLVALLVFGVFFAWEFLGVAVRVQNENSQIVLSVMWSVFVVGLFWYVKSVLFKPSQKYKKDTKKMVMPKITAFFNNITYLRENAGIRKKEIRKSDLFDGFVNVYCDDAFKGTYQGTDFQIAEQRLTTYIQTKHGKREVTVFKGILLQFDFGREFNGQMIVKDKKGQMMDYFLSFLSWAFLILLIAMNVHSFFVDGYVNFDFLIWAIVFIGALLLGIFKSKYEKVYLEDIVFAKNWRVMATDQVEARYILTPALMERMLKIKRMFYGKSLHFAFFDNKVLIAVGTNQDMFETTSLFSSALNYQKVREVIAQFYSIFATIEELKQSTLDRVSKK